LSYECELRLQCNRQIAPLTPINGYSQGPQPLLR